MRKASTIELTPEQRGQLEHWTRSNTVEVRLARRTLIILRAAAGLDNHTIATELGIGRIQVGRWRERFAQGGILAIESDLPRSGRKARVDVAQIVRVTTQTLPEAASHWSTRKLAAHLGVSDSTVLRVWRANGLKPHRTETFKAESRPMTCGTPCT